MSYNANLFKHSSKTFTHLHPYHTTACNETTGRARYFNKALVVSVFRPGSGKEFRGTDTVEESVSNFPLELHF